MLQNFFINLLDILFPRPLDIRELESLKPEIFYEKAFSIQINEEENTKSLFAYRQPIVRKALWELKYRGNTKIAKIFGILLYEAIVDSLSDELLFSNFSNPLIIPIPISKERRKERGWNQSELLVKEIRLHDQRHLFLYPSYVVSRKHTERPQTKLSRKERLKNLKDCFHVTNPDAVKNKNIILIDDVITTGSTIREVSETLRKAGARKVLGFTIAH